MEYLEDLEDPPAFKREEWIGQGKKITNVPIFVLNACTNAFTIPAEQKRHFPSENIMISELLRLDLPSQSSAFILEKAETWTHQVQDQISLLRDPCQMMHSSINLSSLPDRPGWMVHNRL